MTPAPWIISPVRTTEDTAMIVGGVGFEFGLIADVTEDDDAAFIIKAVNNHDKLVRALEQCGAPFSTPPGSVAQCQAAISAEFQRRMDVAADALMRCTDLVGAVQDPK